LARLHLQVAYYLIERRLMFWELNELTQRGALVNNAQTKLGVASELLKLAVLFTDDSLSISNDIFLSSTFTATEILLDPQ
jgi:hypothetical protein